MKQLRAFVGHSFDEKDKDLVRCFLNYFDTIGQTLDFQWEHAEWAELKELSRKVKEKMEGKNLFIGIFTLKDYRVNPEVLNRPIFWERMCAPESEFILATSNWVIQESGYALGKGMQPLFLVEEGVQIGAGLHGDMEHVEFSRENPQVCFQKLLQMLGGILEKEIKEADVVPTTAAPEDSETEEEKNGEPHEEKIKGERSREKFRTHYGALHKAMVNEKNLVEGKAKLQEALDAYKDAEVFNETFWRTQFYSMKIDAGYSDGFKELQKLSEEKEDDPYPANYLAALYRQYKEYPKAAQYFLIASERAKERNDTTEYIGDAANCYARDGNYGQAYEILLNEFRDPNLANSDLDRLYKELANIAKLQKNRDMFIAFSEKALSYSPSDYDLRFSLAYYYEEVGNAPCALHHYDILCTHNPSAGSWNNKGVSFGNLKMPWKEITAYKLAGDEYNSTLAMANIATNYINEGFLEEASEILNRARTQAEYDAKVDKELSRIQSVKESEAKLETKVLEETENERKFMAKYAEAYCLPASPNLTGAWSTRHGTISLEVEESKVTGGGHHIRESINIATVLGATRPSGTEITITLNGSIHNGAIDYQITVDKRSATSGSTSPYATILGGGTSTKSYQGLMCVSADSNLMSAMEREKGEDKPEFYAITRASEE